MNCSSSRQGIAPARMLGPPSGLQARTQGPQDRFPLLDTRAVHHRIREQMYRGTDTLPGSHSNDSLGIPRPPSSLARGSSCCSCIPRACTGPREGRQSQLRRPAEQQHRRGSRIPWDTAQAPMSQMDSTLRTGRRLQHSGALGPRSSSRPGMWNGTSRLLHQRSQTAAPNTDDRPRGSTLPQGRSQFRFPRRATSAKRRRQGR